MRKVNYLLTSFAFVLLFMRFTVQAYAQVPASEAGLSSQPNQ